MTNRMMYAAVTIAAIAFAGLFAFGDNETKEAPRNKREMVAAIVELQGAVQILTSRIGDLEAAVVANHPPARDTPSHGLSVTRVPGERYYVSPNGTRGVVFNVKVKNESTRATPWQACRLVAYDADGDVVAVTQLAAEEFGDGNIDLAVPPLHPGATAVLRPKMLQLDYERTVTVALQIP